MAEFACVIRTHSVLSNKQILPCGRITADTECVIRTHSVLSNKQILPCGRITADTEVSLEHILFCQTSKFCHMAEFACLTKQNVF